LLSPASFCLTSDHPRSSANVGRPFLQLEDAKKKKNKKKEKEDVVGIVGARKKK
jgi:hypothetical protein